MAGPSGIITQRYTYSPFGRVLEAEGEESSALGYTAEQWEGDAGLLYLRARWYDPSTGRFLTKDPFPGYPTLPQSQHPYTYCHNNPINYTDPNGEIPLFVLPLIITLPLLVGGTAWAIDWWLQVRYNMDKRCMSFWEAVYHENLNWNEMANVGLSPTPQVLAKVGLPDLARSTRDRPPERAMLTLASLHSAWWTTCLELVDSSIGIHPQESEKAMGALCPDQFQRLTGL